MWRESRTKARSVGDHSMVRMCNMELGRLGSLEETPETTQDTTVLETVTPAAPRRGRKPKPRCEHNMIADRCVECNPDLAA